LWAAVAVTLGVLWGNKKVPLMLFKAGALTGGDQQRRKT
jgi:hypothetical protein